jgi:hypothetical protein
VDSGLRKFRFLVKYCCGLLILFTPFSHAYADSGKWLLMPRHGECSEIGVLERKVPDIDGIDNPTDFIRLMRQRGYDVIERTMPDVGADATQVDVPER